MNQPPHPNNAHKPARQLLPNRRPSETQSFEDSGTDITVTAGKYPDGTIGEIFINAGHAKALGLLDDGEGTD